MEATHHGDPPVQIIEAAGRWPSINLRELWNYRELLGVLTWRNIVVRYKQTALGVSWAVLQPVFLMVIFTLIFGRLAGLSSRIGNGIPYPIFAYAGLLPWLFFANSLTQGANSLVGNSALITKVYFPRLTIPISNVLAALVDLAVACVVLFGMMAYYGVWPRPLGLLALPLFVLLAVSTSLGVGVWLAALNVTYRDVQYVVPFLVQLWFFATPVVYPAHLVHEPLRTILGLNPMAGVVEGFRWALIRSPAPPIGLFALSSVISLTLLVSGALYFRRMERIFADVV
jgi:lipopolysaccharide transport system permease protein